MKKFLFIVILVFPTLLFSQIFNPVSWEFSKKDLGGSEYELFFKASIDDGWYLYSQFIEDDGPLPTTFTFFESNSYELIGTTQEGEPKQEYDPNFDMILSYFTKETLFSQKVKAIDSNTKVSGELMFMVCDATQCLPPEYVDFSFNLSSAFEHVETKDFDDEESTSSLNLVPTDTEKSENESSNRKGIWSIFILALVSGFIALLTPCFYPMIPMTVSYFLKQSKNKTNGVINALIYGLSIIIIYVSLGVGVSAIFGPQILNVIGTSPIFNFLFFILLLIFAISFFGAFEITLPSSWINKVDKASDRGGISGIFLMALVLALVSFSCTGPLVGVLLVESASGGNYLEPIIGMFGFSLSIAVVFALLAAFPGWLNSMPKSGGWLNSVKVVVGFLELALAFHYLSKVDLVLQTNFLERELFIALWIIIFACLTLYLLGKIKFSHDSDLTHLPISRFMIAIFAGMFTIYMIPGMWGAPLKIFNAFLPPMQYSESPHGVGYIKGEGSTISDSKDEAQHLGPQGIMVFHDYDKGIAHAKKVGLPIMIDFTGWACVNCRKMEEQVWSDSEVKRILTEDIVLISLYVDERTLLAEDEQYETTIAGKKKKVRTVGDKWTVLQAERYKTNSQPYYIILDHNENQLGISANYQDYGEVDLFKTWLQEGIDQFYQ